MLPLAHTRRDVELFVLVSVSQDKVLPLAHTRHNVILFMDDEDLQIIESVYESLILIHV